jgi:hypothetical protein
MTPKPSWVDPHYDSRAGDPQLHTHVVVSNKVRTVYDDGWRSLDGRPMHAAVHALSAHYNAVLADHLTRALGVEWEQRDRGRDRTPASETSARVAALTRRQLRGDVAVAWPLRIGLLHLNWRAPRTGSAKNQRAGAG